MSSLTTISSGGMEESPEMKELVDTRLSLSLVIGAGAGSRPPSPVVELLTAPSPQENQAARTRKGPESGRVGSAAATRQHGKKARTVQSGSDGDRGSRKKLRLTGQQTALMEKSFRAHNVLSHDEKHDLARELGLNPRQVEVWFQNRRARTKLKQTELDCELLRRWCERLSDDNARLRRELADMRSSSSSAFLSRPTAAATVKAACPSCNKPGVGLTNRD
uniref:Uncharacterized protein n=1 Tax=Avena sativa TaxID=4498 RepID=A0ACD5TCV0_AVESA